MHPVELIEGYVSKLKTADKDLRKLEKAAKKQAEKQAETDAQKYTLEEQITNHKRDAASLHSQHQDLQLRYMQAVYQQDAHAQREAQTRRVEIETALQEHGKSIQELGTALDELPTFDEEAAQLATEIEALQFGDGWRFSRQLEPVLVKNQHALQARQTEARRQLPSFTEATRRAVDGAYDEQRQRDDAEQARRETQRAAEAEKAKLTNKVVRDDEGIVIGVRSFDEEGNFVKYTDAKMVSKTG